MIRLHSRHVRASALLRYSLLLVAVIVAFTRPAHAQVGSTTDIVMGRVTGPDTSSVAGARVELTSSETGITRRKTTNEKGEFSILFPDGGGNYTMKVTSIGFGPYTGSVARQSDEDRLVHNVHLTRNPQVLAAVQVRANNNQGQQQDRPTAGSPKACPHRPMTRARPVRAARAVKISTSRSVRPAYRWTQASTQLAHAGSKG